MKRGFGLAAATLILAAASVGGGLRALSLLSASPAKAAGRGEVLVKFRAGATGTSVSAAHARAGGKIRYRSRLTRWQAVVLPPGGDPEEALRRYRLHPAVEAAEFVRERRISKIPNDLKGAQWAFHNTGQAIALCCRRMVCKLCEPEPGNIVTRGTPDADIDAPEAWDLATGSRKIVVAVSDTGVDPNRSDLGLRLVPGWDFVNDDPDPTDDHWHGTAVASIIGAAGNNGVEMTGLSWNVSLMPLKVCSAEGGCDGSDVMAAIDYAVANGANVINMSLACDEHEDPNAIGARVCNAYLPGTCFSQAEHDTVEAAAAAGVVVVEAAANCGSNNDDETSAYPCGYDVGGNICAGATDINDQVAGFSSYGPHTVDVGAPGKDIVVYMPTSMGGITVRGGTSFASPMTAGVAALMVSRTSLTPEAVQERIIQGGDLVPAVSWAFLGGRLNAFNTLKDVFLAGVSCSQAPPGEVNLLADINRDGRADLVTGTTGAGFEVSLDSAKRKIFMPPRPVAAVDPASTVLAGDVDGNGREDLILADDSGYRVLRATKANRFGPAETWSTEPGEFPHAVGDLNGDHRADLLRFTGSFEALLSTGRSFAAPEIWSPGTAGLFFTVADVNGDGFDDLVNGVLEPKGLAVEVSLSNGTGFLPAAEWSTLRENETAFAGKGDFDGDGFEDLLARHPGSGCLRVIRSTGHSFEKPRPWVCPGAADIILTGQVSAKRDGRADVVVHTPDGRWLMLESRR